MKALLDELGWTQAAFAKQIGTSRNTVNSWCTKGPNTLAYRLAMKYLELLAKVIK